MTKRQYKNILLLWIAISVTAIFKFSRAADVDTVSSTTTLAPNAAAAAAHEDDGGDGTSSSTSSLSLDKDHLENMTIEELEGICTSRGFEVVKEIDQETGQAKVYSHEDYVHAARQCLDIEAEMEEILSKHPDLVKEIEAEAERMRQENQELEHKIRDMIHENSELEEHPIGASVEEQDKGEEHVDDYIADENDNDESIKQNATTDTTTTAATDSNEKNQSTIVVEGDINLMMGEDSDEILDLDQEAIASNDEAISGEKGTITKDDTLQQDVSSSLSAPPPAPQEILTFGDIHREVLAKMLEDLQRVGNILLPKPVRLFLMEQMKPLVRILQESTKTVFGMMKRYVSQLLQQIPKEKSNDTESITKNANNTNLQQV